jgi:hypothetical protein
MEQKLDEIKEHIYEIKLDLREHMRRTEAAEELIKSQKTQLDPMWRAFIGAKWSLAALATVGSLYLMYSKII